MKSQPNAVKLALMLFFLSFNFTLIFSSILKIQEKIIFGIFNLGGLMNFLVIAFNDWKMPVLATKLTRESRVMIQNRNDSVIMVKKTKLKCLGDIFIFGDSIYSLGDLFCYAGFLIGFVYLAFSV